MSLSTGKLSGSQWQIHAFQKFSFLLESSNFITGNKYFQLFSLKWQARLVPFSKKCLPNAQVWIILVCLSVVLSDKKCRSMEKTQTNPPSSACNSNTGASPNSHCCLACSPSALFIFLMSSCQILKSSVFKGWDLIKWVNFYHFINNIVKGNWSFLFSFMTMWWKVGSMWRRGTLP